MATATQPRKRARKAASPSKNGKPPEIVSAQKQLSGSGVILIGRTLFQKDPYNADLSGQLGVQKYERMRRDPAIDGHLERLKTHLRSANWTIEEPDEEAGVDQSTVDAMMELCERYIMGDARDRDQDTFKGGILEHILLMLDFGFSAFEKVWGINEKGQQVYARLAPILPQSVREFEIGDLGEIKWLVQYAYTSGGSFERVVIPDPDSGASPEDKIAVFTYRQEGDDYFGRSILRSCYQAWYHKSELWTLDGVQKELAGLGLRVLKIPTSITDKTSAEYVAAMEVAFQLRGGENMGAIIGDDWDFTHSFPGGTAPDIEGSIELCNRQIAHAFNDTQSQFGNTPNGTKNLGESMTRDSHMSDQALADRIERGINSQLVVPLCRRNVGPQRAYPRFKCEDLDKMTGTEKATNLKMLMDAKAIKPDRVLEERLREEYDLPEIDDETREEPPDPLEVAAAQAKAGGNTTGGGEATGGNSNAATAPPPRAVSKAAYPEPQSMRFWRNPMPHESHVALSEIADFLDTEPGRLWHRVIEPFRSMQIRQLAKAAANASDQDLARAQLPRYFEGRMADALSAALRDVYLRGRRDVKAELGPVSKADPTDEEDDLEPAASEMSWVKKLAVGFVAAQLLAMIARAAEAGQSARNADLPKSQEAERVMDAPKSLSVPTLQADLAGTITRVYTNGRNEQAKAMSDQIGGAFYSAVMDAGTCGPCAALDGAEHEMDDATYATPNPNCQGEDRCRCITIYVAREDRQAA